MSYTKHTFCKKLCASVMQEVREKVPTGTLKGAWGFKSGEWQEYQIPDTGPLNEKINFYEKSCCKWHAKASAWTRYLDKLEEQEKGVVK